MPATGLVPARRSWPAARVVEDGRLDGSRTPVPAQFPGGDVGEHLLPALHPAHQAHHRTVGLVLREGALQQPTGGSRCQLADQVDRHVVGRSERAAQREGAGRGQTGDLGRLGGGVLRIPQHHRVALDVDTAAPGPTGQLGVLPGVNGRCCSPLNLTSFSSTTVRAGMLIPSASVSVAKTALIRPAVNSSSTVWRKIGSIPA